MKNDIYKNNNTIIQKLFFFGTFQYCFCNKCQSGDFGDYVINLSLEFELEINEKKK